MSPAHKSGHTWLIEVLPHTQSQSDSILIIHVPFVLLVCVTVFATAITGKKKF